MQIQINLDLGRMTERAGRFLSSRLGRMTTLLALTGAPLLVYAVTKPHTFTDGQAISASQMNSNFDTLFTSVTTLEGRTPRGMIAFFAGSCPTGWAEYTPLRGRFLVGVPLNGSVEGTVGTALTDVGKRTITDVPAHTHSIDPPATGSSGAGSHSHQVGVSGADDNNHTGNGDMVADSDAGYKGFGRNTTSVGDHAHSVDIGAFTSGSAGVTSVDVTMPYLQLRACQLP